MDTAREKVENSLVEKLCHRNGWEYGGEDYDIAVEEVKWFIEQFNKLGYRKVPELKMLSDHEIRQVCLGEGAYWMGEMHQNAATSSPPILMPQFRNVSQAQLDSIKKQIEEANQ